MAELQAGCIDSSRSADRRRARTSPLLRAWKDWEGSLSSSTPWPTRKHLYKEPYQFRQQRPYSTFTFTFHISHFTFHISHFTCHLPPATCHLPPATCHLLQARSLARYLISLCEAGRHGRIMAERGGLLCHFLLPGSRHFLSGSELALCFQDGPAIPGPTLRFQVGHDLSRRPWHTHSLDDNV